MRFFRASLLSILTLVCLSGCGTSDGPATYTERDLPAAIPVQFQGWWKGKTEWDHLHLAPDGMMRLVFPENFQGAFDPALAKPSSNSFLKIIRNQGDTLYAISKEQRYYRETGRWSEPIYSYVMFHYDFAGHTLTYEQQPCNLNEDDMDKSPDEHLARLSRGACTITEERAGLKLWKRTVTYVRETVPE